MMGGKAVLKGLFMYEVCDIRMKLSVFITLQKHVQRQLQDKNIWNTGGLFPRSAKQALKIRNEVNT
jgi:hypothetical protein